MNSRIVYIGIDDTDILGGPGTGRVAKGLAQSLIKLGLVTSLGVSRHQLLVDDKIRYTSHNSSKGLALKTDRSVAELRQPCIDYMRSCFQPGSDPGLCICPESQINEEILRFGKLASTKILTKADALDLAAKYHIFLVELGGSGEGIIGALASVGLRAGGNDGRLVDLRGIKEIKGEISVGEIIDRTDIIRVQDENGIQLNGNELIDSMDWIRPSLVGGQPVLRVKPGVAQTGKPIWVPSEQKHKKGKGEHINE